MKYLLLSIVLLVSIICHSQTTRCSESYDSTLVVNSISCSMPEYSAGDDALMSYLKNKLSSYTLGLEKSYVKFIIDTLGYVRNVCIQSDIIRPKLSENEQRIIEVFETMPPWKPSECKYSLEKIPARYMIAIKSLIK